MLCFHSWKTISSHISRDISYGEPGIKHTCILEQCKKCGKLRSRYIDGIWHFDFGLNKNYEIK